MVILFAEMGNTKGEHVWEGKSVLERQHETFVSRDMLCTDYQTPGPVQSIVSRGVSPTSTQDPAIGTSTALIPQLVAILVKSFGIPLS